ncbi:Uma2 family endonuclease [Tsukamurella spumae]
MWAMTAAPQHLETMSLDQWCALGEDTAARYELVQGVVQVSPRPRPDHSSAMIQLCLQIQRQIDRPRVCLVEFDVLVGAGPHATVRVPDVVVFDLPAAQPLPADQVRLAIEILSPGTRRTDQVTKREEYERAGIDAYWIVDLDAGPSAEILTLEGGAYRGRTERGTFTTSVPCDLSIDLDALEPLG